MSKGKRRIYRRQYKRLLAELTGKVFDNGNLWCEEFLAIDRHFLPVLTTLDVNLWHTDLIEYLHKVHIGGAVEILMVLYRFPSELVLEVEEEGCGHIGIWTALVENLQDALTTVVCYLLLGSYCLITCGCKQSHSNCFEDNLFHISFCYFVVLLFDIRYCDIRCCDIRYSMLRYSMLFEFCPVRTVSRLSAIAPVLLQVRIQDQLVLREW